MLGPIEEQTQAAILQEAPIQSQLPWQPLLEGSVAELASVISWFRRPRVQLGSDSYLDVDPLDAEGPPSGYWPPFLPDSLSPDVLPLMPWELPGGADFPGST